MGYSSDVGPSLRPEGRQPEDHSGRRGWQGDPGTLPSPDTGAVMILRISSVGYGSSHNLLGNLLHRIATLILITIAVALSIDSGNIGLCADKPSVPNILLILADDKY